MQNLSFHVLCHECGITEKKKLHCSSFQLVPIPVHFASLCWHVMDPTQFNLSADLEARSIQKKLRTCFLSLQCKKQQKTEKKTTTTTKKPEQFEKRNHIK